MDGGKGVVAVRPTALLATRRHLIYKRNHSVLCWFQSSAPRVYLAKDFPERLPLSGDMARKANETLSLKVLMN